MSQSHVCLTCGRPFPEGQGIILTLAGRTLEFHSKACAYSFLKDLVFSISEDCVSSPLRDVYEKRQEALEEMKKRAEKKI
ncbi:MULTISPECIES: hypothetical protein [Metallosphaera]|nr:MULTISPECIES: hypothetical protein [Metallosphaera]AKV74728.1 hypothetical protein MsedA_1786 [Metallosphaera sedula]AKV76966.1 hypothetical protein MsedB_1788 [Metallosphaera sedula]AKV79217.1 hypothetical protein MsedC_1786 [Metallosphaera sedula]AKV81462.1 hypothetical protein MsedD_1787 [Metallosphaera sedula]AKV83699.1 hypothetical protein MsedE_1788 [Metallosphaera sedula]